MIAYIWLLFVGTAFCQEFLLWEGRTADPCNKFLDANNNPDCPTNSQWDAPTVTLLVPSVNSQTGLTGLLSIYGVGFASTPGFIALATTAESCSAIDGTFAPTALSLVTQANTYNSGSRLTVDATVLGNNGWYSQTLELEDRPRLVCWSADGIRYRYSGFKWGVVWSCNNLATSAATTCASTVVQALSAQWTGLSPIMKQARIQRTLCCVSHFNAPPFGKLNGGQCINPNIQACCGGAAYEIATQKCCNAAKEWVASIDQQCPCTTVGDCPIGELCCLPTKYPEIAAFYSNTNFTNGQVFPPQYRGQCYRPSRMSCCDTGAVYDPGAQQCCVINGVQSINTPCPCNLDTDCAGSQQPSNTRTTTHVCCGQTAPVPFPSDTIDSEPGQTSNAICSIYANYPTGTGPANIQRCRGQCIDPAYQICCNGAACMKIYDVCCNATCCNRWTGTCFLALHPGTPGVRYNPLNFGEANAQNLVATAPMVWEACSSVEALNTVKGFWIFVLPSLLLLVSHVGLALVFVFASKATPRFFSKLEWATMAIAFVVIYLSMTFFFAPIWKYGVWVIFACLVVFLAAAARIRWLNVLAVVILFITLVYLYDPFHGNAWLTLSLDRVTLFTSSPDDIMSSGILHSITRSWHTVDLTAAVHYCQTFYDYFALDPLLRDVDRYDNPSIITFGYCSRGWVTALLFFAGFVMMGVLVLLILALLGVFFRFHKDRSEVELEVRPELDY